MQGRNWLTTLHPASYKGVAFQTERDEEDGGRRIVTHEFPMRDVPFNEDLGEAKREFSITAYVASDNADGEAAALVAACASRGPGILVLPTHGAILAVCLRFGRHREKDRAGYIAFRLRFVREGAATALISSASLANLIFVAADNLRAAVAGFIASIFTTGPDFVVAAAAEALQDGVTILEAVRTTDPVDAAASAIQRDAIQAVFDGAAATFGRTVDGDQVAELVTIARALGDGMAPEAAIAAFDIALSHTEVVPAASYFTANERLADQNRAAVMMVARLAILSGYAEAIGRAAIPDRPSAITLRANAADYFEAALNTLSAGDHDFYVAVAALRDRTIDFLSHTILNLVPVVSVSANKRMPSLWWGHRLYQDPARGAELVARNRVGHPSFMPQDFEALAQ